MPLRFNRRWPSDVRKLNVEHFWGNPLIIFGTYIQLNRDYMCSFVWFFKYCWATDTSDYWPFGPLTPRTINLSDHWPFGLSTFRTNELSDQWTFGPMPWNRTGTGDCCLFLTCNINVIIISEQRKLNQINSSHLQQNVHLGQRHPHLHRVQLESAARRNVYR